MKITKFCPDCGETKPIQAFNVRYGDRYFTYCKDCHRTRAKYNQAANPEAHRESARNSMRELRRRRKGVA